MLSLLALVLLGTPAAAARRGRATIDNAHRATVSLWIDGVAVGTVGPRQRVAFQVRAGARNVELVQRSRNCVLSDDLVHLPTRSGVAYRVDQGCGPRPVIFVQDRSRPGASITWRPDTLRVVRHVGPVGAPSLISPRRRTGPGRRPTARRS